MLQEKDVEKQPARGRKPKEPGSRYKSPFAISYILVRSFSGCFGHTATRHSECTCNSQLQKRNDGRYSSLTEWKRMKSVRDKYAASLSNAVCAWIKRAVNTQKSKSTQMMWGAAVSYLVLSGRTSLFISSWSLAYGSSQRNYWRLHWERLKSSTISSKMKAIQGLSGNSLSNALKFSCMALLKILKKGIKTSTMVLGGSIPS